MSEPNLVAQILALPDDTAQRRFVEQHVSQEQELAQVLKEQADRFLRSDVHRSLSYAGLLYHLAEQTGNLLHRAQGLIAEGNARCLGGLGEYERAIELYDQAARDRKSVV